MKRQALWFIPVIGIVLWSCSSEQLPPEAREKVALLSESIAARSENLMIPSATGALFPIRMAKPEGTGPFPVVIGCAMGDGYFAFDMPGAVREINDLGVIAVDFAPQGRVTRNGVDDYNGPIHQGDLKALIEFCAGLDFVDQDEIGLVSFSYGVVMATGTLAKNPDLPVAFLIDWEGPSCPGRDFQEGIERDSPWVDQMYRYIDRENEYGGDWTQVTVHGGKLYDTSYWDDRDAGGFARSLPCAYQRIQADVDHVQGRDKFHMIRIINAVTESTNQWTRLNRNAPGVVYTEDDLSSTQFHQPQRGPAFVTLIVGYIEEMLFEKPWAG